MKGATVDELDPQQRLLKALDALTKPQHVAQWQDPKAGKVKKTIFKRTDPPLLDWLHDAIANSVGGSGGGKQARERTPMDMTAFALYEDIDGRVRSWLSELEATPGRGLTPTSLLRTWYVLWIVRNPGDRLKSSFASVFEGWVDAINDALDPPKRIEITAPCPVCGQEWINVGLKLEDGSDDPDDTERVRVLWAIERENMTTSYALCKACDRVWMGTGQMRQLRIAIDDAEDAITA